MWWPAPCQFPTLDGTQSDCLLKRLEMALYTHLALLKTSINIETGLYKFLFPRTWYFILTFGSQIEQPQDKHPTRKQQCSKSLNENASHSFAAVSEGQNNSNNSDSEHCHHPTHAVSVPSPWKSSRHNLPRTAVFFSLIFPQIALAIRVLSGSMLVSFDIFCLFFWRSVGKFFGWNPHFRVKKWHFGFTPRLIYSYNMCPMCSRPLDLTCKVIHFETQINLTQRNPRKTPLVILVRHDSGSRFSWDPGNQTPLLGPQVSS